MEYLRGSPARLLNFKEKLACEFDFYSTPKSVKDRHSRLEGLNLSARKSLSLPLPSKSSSAQSPSASRQLFKYSTLNTSFKGNIREKLEENVQSLKEVLVETLPKRKESTTKRKFSIIMNDNRANYEPVDLSVDLCCDVIEDAHNDNTEQSHKKLRMSV